jgi:acetylglutamate kinase
VKSVNLAPIEASLHAGSIPVITSLGETAGGQILNVNADFAANELVQVLQPYKIIFLTGTGGLLDEKGKVIDSINLSTEYDHLIAQPWINGGMKVKIEQIKDLLDRCRWSRRCRSRGRPTWPRNCSPTRVRARWCAAARRCCA